MKLVLITSFLCSDEQFLILHDSIKKIKEYNLNCKIFVSEGSIMRREQYNILKSLDVEVIFYSVHGLKDSLILLKMLINFERILELEKTYENVLIIHNLYQIPKIALTDFIVNNNSKNFEHKFCYSFNKDSYKEFKIYINSQN